jgi:hypothetical protein
MSGRAAGSKKGNMPKPSLRKEDVILESQVIKTMIAGLKKWRPDLSYPQSYSDMQVCVRGLLTMYNLKRKPLPEPVKIECHYCMGLGQFIQFLDRVSYLTACKKCGGHGWIEG